MDEAGNVRVTRGDTDLDGDLSALDGDAFDEAEGDNVTAEAGVTDGREGGADVGLVGEDVERGERGNSESVTILVGQVGGKGKGEAARRSIGQDLSKRSREVGSTA